MDKSYKVNISRKILNEFEIPAGVIELVSLQDFENIIKLDKAIIYLQVNWSGPERLSRFTFFSAINKLKNEGIPIFIIDCSDQKKEYVKDWLINQRENRSQFYYGGWGETILISKGEIIDFIANPAKIGIEKTQIRVNEWYN